MKGRARSNASVVPVTAAERLSQACRYRPLCRSTPAIEVRPLAGLDEVSPIERMELRVALEHFELHLAQSRAAPPPLFEISVVARHQRARRIITRGPEAHHKRLRAGKDEGAAQTIDAFAVA